MAAPLPLPDSEALAHSHRLVQMICSEIEASNGWIDFARYMHLALYSPGLGYYAGGAKKFGMAGDFVTAPEMSPLFGQTLARQAAQVLQQTRGSLLELGAGTGKLCVHLLLELQKLDALPEQYLILEVSAHLREVQQQTLRERLPSELFSCVQWLDRLPENFKGLVLANEVLDALPVRLVQTADRGIRELGVACGGEVFRWQEHEITSNALKEKAAALNLPAGYKTEICLAIDGLMASLANVLEQGVLLLIDYGFSRHEYYHAQRSEGTLMCHYRHHAHGDPFLYPGLQDITAHVDFTTVAEAGVVNGLQLIGFCSQAQFLINCGITGLLQQASPSNIASYAAVAAQAQKLLSPAEMGELFKVIALGKNCNEPLIGFVQGDKRHKL
ncbi:MAG TPA: SAM-dependent methyltransferase [Methylophilaceae bacterium]|nr:SAM-dependent methyltransferase [Methylophilaceae bacterium]